MQSKSTHNTTKNTHLTDHDAIQIEKWKLEIELWFNKEKTIFQPNIKSKSKHKALSIPL